MFSLNITASRSQAATYFLCVCLFSISFLVFLNSSVSFVITERIGQKGNVGDAVGTLGFADELLALVACPLWGALSDRVGVRTVAVTGYVVVGIALMLFVQAKNVYPQLLLARLFFSIGGAATSTMVTAILPTMTESRTETRIEAPSGQQLEVAPSISSELTITPARIQDNDPLQEDPSASSSRLAGFVGMFTGFGALVALFVFLPLPRHFTESGSSRSEAVAQAFYVVGAVALGAAILSFFGLKSLPTEENKSLRDALWFMKDKKSVRRSTARKTSQTSYFNSLLRALGLGLRDVDIGLAYLAGFVARASSVGISLFIPLFVNTYFISTGKCPANPDGSTLDPGQIKKNCQRAYVVASILTGVSQLVALICAPAFGFLTSKYRRVNAPLLVGAGAGVAGFVSLGLIRRPDPRTAAGSVALYFTVSLIGISQISAIVCSLGLLSRGIQRKVGNQPVAHADDESSALIPNGSARDESSGKAILASLNGILLVVGGFCALLNILKFEETYDNNRFSAEIEEQDDELESPLQR
jgi:MFS family permease